MTKSRAPDESRFDVGAEVGLRFVASVNAKFAKRVPLGSMTSMRLPKGVPELVDQIAANDGRSRNQVLVALLLSALDLYFGRGLEIPSAPSQEPLRSDPDAIEVRLPKDVLAHIDQLTKETRASHNEVVNLSLASLMEAVEQGKIVKRRGALVEAKTGKMVLPRGQARQDKKKK